MRQSKKRFLPRAGDRHTFGVDLLVGASAALLMFLGACSNSTGLVGSNLDVGSIATDPATGKSFIVTSNRGGAAPAIKVVRAFWGRIVDVYDTEFATGETRLQFEGFTIGDNILSNGVDFLLERSPVTEKETLTILHEVGTASYQAAFGKLSKDTQPLLDRSLTDLPPYSAVARNAVIVFEFDDLLDHSTINSKTFPVTVGYPPVTPFESRIVADMSHGDLTDADGDGVEEFHTTRVIIDPTVSTIEALESNPPLPVNSLGLPAAQVIGQANVFVRIPTIANPSIGQFAIVRNPSGAGLALTGSGSTDTQSPTLDVVRAFRSRGAAVGDDFNGFLRDDALPEIIGVQAVNVVGITSLGAGVFEMDFDFQTIACGATPDVADVIETPDHLAEVIELANPPGNGQARGVRLSLLTGDASTFLLFRGLAEFKTTFDPSSVAPPACFVRYSIEPTNPPDVGVNPQSSITVLFSEPMDPSSVQAFETFKVQRKGNTGPFEERVVGRVDASLDLREFRFRPTLPFTHSEGLSEGYVLDLVGGPDGTIDLAGNAVRHPLLDSEGLAPEFTLDPNQPTARTNGVSFKYDSQDEDENGSPEIRGQFLYDLARGVIKPRPVNRFSAVADSSQPVVGAMIPFTAPIQTPLSNWGSKMMTVWRYHDVGFGLTDENTMNVDVEFLAWAPFAGVQTDAFSNFRLAVTHSFHLPDEVVDANLLPVAPFSGIVKEFDDNVLSATEDPLSPIHPKSIGYIVRPLDVFLSTTGTLMMPWPVNRDPQEGTPLPVAQRKTFTWRDTGKVSVGGPTGTSGIGGVDTQRYQQVTGGGQDQYYRQGVIPPVGLPLLLEFRCYADEGAFGLNGFKINLAINSSSRPNFRAYSTGGILANGTPHIIDPDNEPVATGGINPNTGQPTGAGTELDNSFYPGQADFVVRVNRVHSIWIAATAGATQFAEPVLEPSPSLQPLGTSVSIAFRGCIDFAPSSDPEHIADIRRYDFYGNPIKWAGDPSSFDVNTYVNGDASWQSSPAGITGARFFQYRLTMISNPDSTLTPELSGLGIAYSY